MENELGRLEKIAKSKNCSQIILVTELERADVSLRVKKEHSIFFSP